MPKQHRNVNFKSSLFLGVQAKKGNLRYTKIQERHYEKGIVRLFTNLDAINHCKINELNYINDFSKPQTHYNKLAQQYIFFQFSFNFTRNYTAIKMDTYTLRY